MCAIKMLYKHLIATGFHTHHFKTFLEMFSIKCFENILSQKFVIPIFLECLLNVCRQTLSNKDVSEQY